MDNADLVSPSGNKGADVMGRKRLERIAARVAQATPGAWTVRHAGNVHYGVTQDRPMGQWKVEVVYATADRNGYGNGSRQEDAEFIAHARQDIPWLIERLEWAWARESELLGELARQQEFHHVEREANELLAECLPYLPAASGIEEEEE